MVRSSCGPTVSSRRQEEGRRPWHQKDAAGNTVSGTTHTLQTHLDSCLPVVVLTVCFPVQLTATKSGRQTMKDKNVYPIMREFHKWEKDIHARAACEKLVQVRNKRQLQSLLVFCHWSPWNLSFKNTQMKGFFFIIIMWWFPFLLKIHSVTYIFISSVAPFKLSVVSFEFMCRCSSFYFDRKKKEAMICFV